MTNSRTVAVKILQHVLQQGRSLTEAFDIELTKYKNIKEQALVKELCFGVLRWYTKLLVQITPFLQKPLRNKDQDIELLLLLGCYQLLYLNIAEHATLFNTVAVADDLKKTWAKGVVNGVLRNIQRQKAELLKIQHHAHPQWFVDKITAAWPIHWQAILEANNQHPPMILRVNEHERDDYLVTLAKQSIAATPLPVVASGVLLAEPQNINELPGFTTGDIFVQDGATQLAAYLLDLKPYQRVLDACAAPGGKTTHILQLQPQLSEVVAVDESATRLQRLKENLIRCRVQATVITADVSDTKTWWDGQQFDRILLDAPCSATGVIRRHPDIKWLRRETDITTLAKTQQHILLMLWPLLKPGGKLVYATCSVLPEENQSVVENFLATHPDSHIESINYNWGHDTGFGRQIFPGEQNMDGFFYSVLFKS